MQHCRKKGACKDCGRKQSSLLTHPPVPSGNQNKHQNPPGKQKENRAVQGREPAVPKVNNGFIEVEPALSGFTGMSKATVGLPVVPVKVTGKGYEKPLITYAFLDNGSSSTFCTEDLLNEFGLKGEETSFSSPTIEKQNSKVKCNVVSLVVHNLQENEFIDLPSVFSKQALAITCNNIPKQEDVKRWPKKPSLKCADQRRIALISHASKVMLKILKRRITPTVESVLDDYQAGFEAGRSTAEQVTNLRILCEEYNKNGSKVLLNFVDCRKEFDRVWHDAI